MPYPELAILALIAATWRQLRALFDRLRAVLICRYHLRGNIARITADYLLTQSRVLRWGDGMVESLPCWVRPLGRMAEVVFEGVPIVPVLCVIQRRVVLMRRASEGGGAYGGDSRPTHDGEIYLWWIRGTLSIDDFTRQALDWHNQFTTESGNRYRVIRVGNAAHLEPRNGNAGYPSNVPTPSSPEFRPSSRFLHWSAADIGSANPPHPFAGYALGAVAGACRDDFRQWLGLKDWYQERRIPWRRGYLLYGPPGTGKTALVRALAQEADMPVYSYDLASLSNHAFEERWREMQEQAPCIALLEDIDGVFDGRRNIHAESGKGQRDYLTFDSLLQALGGIDSADGVVTFITTNRHDTLDEALGRPTADGEGTTRPGRIDRAYCLPSPDEQQRREILTRIMGHASAEDLAHTTGWTAAQVTDHAIREALRAKWEAQTAA